ncbi:MAG TPA: phospholipase D-like domain-containing protein [Rhodopseudomonas sp.]|uniref:phospholipase D-like domain-containing protein n=1 Tax=Rhodopseudomonas sp. TaxID=1078 RepID=UPI002ED9DBC4
MENDEQRDYNRKFVERFLARRPAQRERYQKAIEAEALAPRVQAEAVGGIAASPVDVVNETIVREQRPVLFVRNDWIDTVEVSLDGDEARDLVTDLNASRTAVEPIMPLVGRIDVVDFPGNLDFVGTAWFVAADIVVTNRHVAQLIAQQDGRRFVFSRGVAGKPISASLNTVHEFDDLAANQGRVFDVKQVLYIEKTSGPNDIAFIQVARTVDGARPAFIAICDSNLAVNAPVVTIGYPAKAPKRMIPDQAWMKQLFRDRYDVKRAAPGLIMAVERNNAAEHDCSTLGGNSGAAVIDPKTGRAAGLHFAGLYKQANYAVPASVLSDYIKRERWREPPVLELNRGAPLPRPGSQSVAQGPAPPQQPSAAPQVVSATGGVEISIPLIIRVSLGQPQTSSGGGAPASGSSAPPSGAAPDIETAVAQFWNARPDGVLAARVGFLDDGEAIGDAPCIAASVLPSRLAAVAAAVPSQFQGFPVRYFPASVAEQIEAGPAVESVDSIAYDDDARSGEQFSFAEVNEPMTIRAHVGPEYSWDELKAFLAAAPRTLVSAMYEFHAAHIKDALQERLDNNVALQLVLDNASFSKVKDPDGEFDRIPTFKAWEKFAGFERIVAPEGTSGLISDAYHIKVTVRDDDVFWLSSGNWKAESSQPIITQQQRDDAADTDLPGNREWHVVIHNATLSGRFRSHIQQDFKRSTDLGGGVVPKSKMVKEVEVPLEEGVELERRPPGRVVEPLEITRKVKVKPLLTPDREGAVYSEAVLDLIKSARNSLLFQIPYIGMPSNPRQDRGYIDELIKALTQKLKTLDDARVILRTGGAKYSDPTHAAWYFKSKGVDIAERLRRIDDSHTKGMIVDGQRILLGSHNWSKPGVTLNRDASLIFDDQELAGYYAQAFEIDWARATAIRPKQFVKAESVATPGGEFAVVPLFQRVSLQDLPTEG